MVFHGAIEHQLIFNVFSSWASSLQLIPKFTKCFQLWFISPISLQEHSVMLHNCNDCHCSTIQYRYQYICTWQCGWRSYSWVWMPQTIAILFIYVFMKIARMCVFFNTTCDRPLSEGHIGLFSPLAWRVTLMHPVLLFWCCCSFPSEAFMKPCITCCMWELFHFLSFLLSALDSLMPRVYVMETDRKNLTLSSAAHYGSALVSCEYVLF